ncbi:MAG: hypothetical protein ACREAB_10450 [Blastocatellia bacterium]
MMKTAQTSLPAFGISAAVIERRVGMFKQSCSFTPLILSLALIGLTLPANAQNKKQGAKPARGVVERVNIEIRNVSKKDALAKKNSDGKSRLVPVNFQFICNGTDAGKFFDLEAVLETINSDGTKSRASKSIKDGTSNTLLEERIDLPTPEGVFARDFTLTLRGKWRVGNAAKLVDVSAVKKGGFPPPANPVEREK